MSDGIKKKHKIELQIISDILGLLAKRLEKVREDMGICNEGPELEDCSDSLQELSKRLTTY